MHGPETSFFVDVILPLSLDDMYTYHCSEEEFSRLQKGMRVAVAFGKSSVQTALVFKKHREKPMHFNTRPILEIVDTQPIVNEKWWDFIDFVSRYYITPPGLTVRLALPSSFFLKSDRYLALNPHAEIDKSRLSDDAFLIVEALEKQSILSVDELFQITGKKNKTLQLLHRLVDEGIISVYTEIKERYKPKFVKYIDVAVPEREWNAIPDKLRRSPRQRDLFLHFLSLYLPTRQPVLKSELIKPFSSALLRELVKKGILREIEVPVDRQVFEAGNPGETKLTPAQQQALEQIEQDFKARKTVLLHGVTASGKTEIYARLIEKVLANGGQVLYMVPEISLTTHLVNRLKSRFGTHLGVYHSRYSFDERHEVWMHVLHGDEKARLVVGTRSALFLPFHNLKLIIVDEEHDDSFKENFHQPHYQARDMATVLAKIHDARVVMGSATPSVESWYNAQKGKYALVELHEKYHRNKKPPAKVIIDLKEVYRQNRRKGHFSFEVLDAMQRELDEGGQVLVFINRRGYAPMAECKTCGHVEMCPHCSVSLTYHKHDNKLKCHYCGYQMTFTGSCTACGSTDMDLQGAGTEQIADELEALFPGIKTGRMDADTTRKKKAFEKIITDFDTGRYQILVGTQMITKGLDFGNVGLVVIPRADRLIHFPDFRAHERAFQMLEQVAGRTGRREKPGKVMLQTFAPEHPLLKFFLRDDFKGFMSRELHERELFKYPPFFKLIKFEFRSKNPQNLHEATHWFHKALTYYFDRVLGPSEPLIFKIRNQYRLEILVKYPSGQSFHRHSGIIRKLVRKYKTVRAFRNVRIDVNPDP